MTRYNENIDNKLLPIAKRYSKALLDVARSKNDYDEICEDLANIDELLSEESNLGDFKKFLLHPAIPVAEKKDLIKSIFEGKVQQETLNLLYLLVEKNKINLVPAIFHAYEDALDAEKNILKIHVVSAVEMDEDSISKLKAKLESVLHQQVKFDFEIDPDIIAGLVLRTRCITYDGSIAAKLERFEKVLVN